MGWGEVGEVGWEHFRRIRTKLVAKVIERKEEYKSYLGDKMDYTWKLTGYVMAISCLNKNGS